MKKIIKQSIITTLAIIVICGITPIITNADSPNLSPIPAYITNVTPTNNTTPNVKFKPFICYVNKITVNIRKQANKNSKIAQSVYKGTKFKVLEIQGNWYRVGKNKWIHKNHVSKKNPMGKYKGIQLRYSEVYNVTKTKLTRSRGRLHYKGHTETWYSSKEPGQTRTAYYIPDKHLAKDGTYRDKDGYICIAASGKYAKGAKIMTSRGPGKVYDRGVSGNVIDIYTNW